MNSRSHQVSLGPVLLLSQLETLAQKVIEYSPATRLRLQALSGRVAQVAITLPQLNVFIEFADGSVRLTQHCEFPVAVKIEGSAPALLRQLLQPGQFRAGGGVSVEGDIALAQTLSQLARQLDFDWEELLAEHVGDAVAHQIGQTLRWGAGFLGAFARKALQDGRRFLVSEQPMLVERPGFDRFGNEVHQLRQDYDRLEARVAQLQQRALDRHSTASTTTTSTTSASSNPIQVKSNSQTTLAAPSIPTAQPNSINSVPSELELEPTRSNAQSKRPDTGAASPQPQE